MKKSVRRKKNIMNKKIIILLIFLLAILALLYLFKRLDLKQIFVPIYEVSDRTSNVKKASKKYSDQADVVGWIKVQGTNIDYPVVYEDGSTTERYSFNYAWINRNNKKLTNRPIIFSHNIRNVSSQPLVGDKEMDQFEQLMSYIYYNFNKDNKYIQYTVNGKNYLYQIFSVSIVDDNLIDYYDTAYTKKEMKKYIKESLNDSYFKYDVDVGEDDKIITLVTCTRFDGKLLNDFKIDAKLIDKNKGYNYNVSEKKNYNYVKKILKGDGNDV